MVTPLSTSPATVIVAATDTAGSAPTSVDDGYEVNLDGGLCRTFFTYVGTVSSCVVRLYTRPVGAGDWYQGASTDDGTALTGVNEARDWDVGEGTEVTFVVESIAGGGTVAVSAIGVQR